MPKFGTKNALFGYFGLEFEINIVLFESFCLIGKLREKIKVLKFGTNNA